MMKRRRYGRLRMHMYLEDDEAFDIIEEHEVLDIKTKPGRKLMTLWNNVCLWMTKSLTSSSVVYHWRKTVNFTTRSVFIVKQCDLFLTSKDIFLSW